MRLRQILLGDTDSTTIHLIRATLSSTLGFAVDFGILVALVELAGLHYLIAATIGFTIGTTITYLAAIFWIFSRRRISLRAAEFGIFLMVGVIGVILNDGLLWVFTERLSIYYMVSRMMSACIVFFWNFFARKRLLFR